MTTPADIIDAMLSAVPMPALVVDRTERIIAAAARAIRWSLCIVSSRGTAASPDLGGGSTRLVPLADMFNHNLQSDGFIELTAKDVGARDDLLGSRCLFFLCAEH